MHLNAFVIPDEGIKTPAMITDVAKPLMPAVIYRNTMAVVAARGMSQEFLLMVPRVCQ